MSTQSFAERAKAAAATFRDKSKEAFTAFAEHKPCVQCGTKDGALRFACTQCHTLGFCHNCSDYCSVKHSEVPVYTTREKATEAAVTAKTKSVELYNKALQKWKNRKATQQSTAEESAKNGSDEAAATTTGQSIAADESQDPALLDPTRPKEEQYITQSVCRLCFRNSVHSLDLSKNFDIVGPQDNSINATIIAVHAGGNTRGSLRRMAEQLIQYRIRTILIDLPGHGGRMDEPLSIESAIETIHYASTELMKQATEKDDKAGLLLLLGVGLGGYAAMEYLGRSTPRKFDGAVIINAGSGVGKDEASFWAKTALTLATSASTTVGAKVFVSAALREIKKTPTLLKDEVHENLIDTGLYFHSATAQLNTLKAVATKVALSQFFGPVLFMDGSKDYHDMVDIFTNISVNNELRTFRRGGEGDGADGAANDDDTAEGGLIILSRSIQYPLGTTLFLHDSRFADESFADIAVFVQQLTDRADLVAKNPSLVLSNDELKALVSKQKEATEAKQAATTAAATSEQNKTPNGGSFFERAKGTWSKFTSKKSSPAEEGAPTTTNTDSNSNSAANNHEPTQEGHNTRASTVSVAVPHVAYVERSQTNEEVPVTQSNVLPPREPVEEEEVETSAPAATNNAAEPPKVVVDTEIPNVGYSEAKLADEIIPPAPSGEPAEETVANNFESERIVDTEPNHPTTEEPDAQRAEEDAVTSPAAEDTVVPAQSAEDEGATTEEAVSASSKKNKKKKGGR